MNTEEIKESLNKIIDYTISKLEKNLNQSILINTSTFTRFFSSSTSTHSGFFASLEHNFGYLIESNYNTLIGAGFIIYLKDEDKVIYLMLDYFRKDNFKSNNANEFLNQVFFKVHEILNNTTEDLNNINYLTNYFKIYLQAQFEFAEEFTFWTADIRKLEVEIERYFKTTSLF